MSKKKMIGIAILVVICLVVGVVGYNYTQKGKKADNEVAQATETNEEKKGIFGGFFDKKEVPKVEDAPAIETPAPTTSPKAETVSNGLTTADLAEQIEGLKIKISKFVDAGEITDAEVENSLKDLEAKISASQAQSGNVMTNADVEAIVNEIITKLNNEQNEQAKINSSELDLIIADAITKALEAQSGSKAPAGDTQASQTTGEEQTDVLELTDDQLLAIINGNVKEQTGKEITPNELSGIKEIALGAYSAGTITHEQALSSTVISQLAVAYANGQIHLPEEYSIKDTRFDRSAYSTQLIDKNITFSDVDKNGNSAIREAIFAFFDASIDSQNGKGWEIPAAGVSTFDKSIQPGEYLWVSTGHVTIEYTDGQGAQQVLRFNCTQDYVEQICMRNTTSKAISVHLSRFYNPGIGSETFYGAPSLELMFEENFERALRPLGDTLDGSGKQKNFNTFIDMGTGEIISRFVLTGKPGSLNAAEAPYTY